MPRRRRSSCTRLTAKWCGRLRSAARAAFDGHADAGLVFMRCAYWQGLQVCERHSRLICRKQPSGLVSPHALHVRIDVDPVADGGGTHRHQGTVEAAINRGVRATPTLEDIWCEKIRCCSCRGSAVK